MVAEQLELLPRSRIVLIDELIDPLLYLIEGLHLALLPQCTRFTGKRA